MIASNSATKEIESLVLSKGLGPVLINALELPWIPHPEFDEVVHALVQRKRLTLIDEIGDWVIGNLIHYEVEMQQPTSH